MHVGSCRGWGPEAPLCPGLASRTHPSCCVRRSPSSSRCFPVASGKPEPTVLTSSQPASSSPVLGTLGSQRWGDQAKVRPRTRTARQTLLAAHGLLAPPEGHASGHLPSLPCECGFDPSACLNPPPPSPPGGPGLRPEPGLQAWPGRWEAQSRGGCRNPAAW